MKNTLFKWDAQVRDYELDSQGIVNNANYLHFLEQGRNEYVRNLGIDFAQFHTHGFIFVVTDLQIHYHRPLKSRDAFYVTVEITHYDNKRIYFSQKLYFQKNDKRVAEATVNVACVDHQTWRVTVPALLKEIFSQHGIPQG